ncbi:MAG TPA: hypothetical protein DCX07_00430, partial [Phycisphaerales bacterium]|nr:hypothetical protein [Phycisphaerales bacterium]
MRNAGKSKFGVILAATMIAAVVVLGWGSPAGAALVFQADFNGSGSGTGGAGDIVTSGGTGSLTDASVIGTSPLSSASGNYLNVVDSGAGTGYATFSP